LCKLTAQRGSTGLFLYLCTRYTNSPHLLHALNPFHPLQQYLVGFVMLSSYTHTIYVCVYKIIYFIYLFINVYKCYIYLCAYVERVYLHHVYFLLSPPPTPTCSPQQTTFTVVPHYYHHHFRSRFCIWVKTCDFGFLSWTYLSKVVITSSIHFPVYGMILFFFKLSKTPEYTCVYVTFSLFISCWAPRLKL
jgi:hypothetical protein